MYTVVAGVVTPFVPSSAVATALGIKFAKTYKIKTNTILSHLTFTPRTPQSYHNPHTHTEALKAKLTTMDNNNVLESFADGLDAMQYPQFPMHAPMNGMEGKSLFSAYVIQRNSDHEAGVVFSCHSNI